MKTSKTLLAASLVSLCAFSFGASAQMVKSSDQINAEYKAADKACDSMKGDQKDACQARAKADRDTARADAKEGAKDAKNRKDAVESKRDANYDAAKAQCGTMSGDAKDKCMTDAKTKYAK